MRRSAAPSAGWDSIDLSAACPARAGWPAGRRAGRQAGGPSSRNAMNCQGRAGGGRRGAPSSRAPSCNVLLRLLPARRLCAAAAVGTLWRRGSASSLTAARSRGVRSAKRWWRWIDRCALNASRRLRAGARGGVRVPLVAGAVPGNGTSSVAAAPRGWRRRYS